MGDLKDLFRQCQLVTNLSDTEETLLFHEPTQSIIRDIDPKAIGMRLNKEEKEWFFKDPESGRTSLAKFIYDPYQTQGPRGIKGLTPTFNTYVPPLWRHDSYFHGAPIVPERKIPPLIAKFLAHFSAGDTDSAEFMLDWLATALHRRNGTYLCILSKIQGTGKGVLGEMCRTIFGENNARKVRGDALNSRFNGQFANAQFIMFDEFDLKNAASLDRAKDLVNAKLEVEKKGKDAVEMDNQLNGMFTSNHMGAIPEIGRRFSLPMTSDVQLKLTFTTEEIRTLQYDTKMLCNFARYLWWREVKRDMWLPFLSARTVEVRDYGLKEWESLLAEEVFNRVPKGAFLRQDAMKRILKEKAPNLRHLPGRKPFGELAFKFPEHIKHHYRMVNRRQEWGFSFLQEFPDYQVGFWCLKCEGLIPESCNCRRDP